jgi:ubiquinone/menaquinone biosynthesis C-methylase UbiE
MKAYRGRQTAGTALVGHAWSFYAQFYDNLQPFLIKTIGAFGDLSYDEFEEKFIELAKPQPGRTVLDVACGTGASHPALSRVLGSKGEIVAVDVSAEMLRRAKSRARRHKLRNIHYEKADAEQLSLQFDKDSFDMVLSCNGLPNFLHPRRALAEMMHVLRPGGTLAVSTISRNRCDENFFWRLSLKYPKGRLPYEDEYREMIEDLEAVRIGFHEIGLMLIITAKKRKGRTSRGNA